MFASFTTKCGFTMDGGSILMNRYLLFGHKISLQKLRSSVLALFWLIGLGVGIAFALSYCQCQVNYHFIYINGTICTDIKATEVSDIKSIECLFY